jgi:capsular exopolysaccharide synthesis family protein
VQVSVLEPSGLPDSPVSPKPVRNGAAAVLLGAVLAWGMVLLAERLDSSVKNRQEAEDVAGLPVLSLVPSVKTPEGQLLRAGATPAGESFRVLRTAIRFAGADDPVKVLAVTSPEASDGKTTSAFNLAAAFADSGSVTVLIEADMRKPSLAKQLRLGGKASLSAYLLGTAELKGLVQKTPVENLFLISAGSTPANPGELLSSERMGKLLRSLSKEANVVIIDTPPVLAVSDAAALTPMIDGAIVVVRAGSTSKEHLREALRVLGGVGAPVLGLILNGVAKADGYYGYGYYAYGKRPAAGSEPAQRIPTRPFVAPAPDQTNGNGNGRKKTRTASWEA